MPLVFSIQDPLYTILSVCLGLSSHKLMFYFYFLHIRALKWPHAMSHDLQLIPLSHGLSRNHQS